MKPPAEDKGSREAVFFLFVALVCFGFDLFHFAHHLHHDPTLLDLEGVRLKVVWKIGLITMVISTLLLPLFQRERIR